MQKVRQVLAAAVFAGMAASAGAQAPTVKNVVLVHGAFADGSGWRGVYDQLTRRGYRVTIVQNPLTSLHSKLTNAAWRTRPSWAVIASEDKAFDQAMLLHMAKRIGARITTVTGSHAVFITQARVVADTIEQAAQEASKAAVARR